MKKLSTAKAEEFPDIIAMQPDMRQKEAVSKAFGTGIGRNASFNEIEIVE